jgi:predicted integral membrane protein DUF2269
VPLIAIVLPIHIALAIALFVPALLLPFALRTERPATESRSRLVRFLLRMQGGGSVVIGIGLVVSGALLVGGLGLTVVDQPWLLVALAIYALNLGIALFVQRPNLRALVGLRAAWDDRTWLAAARRQRYVSYAMAGLIGVIGYLMSAKPQL